ncbi:MAG TPA: hypothetical protein VF294_15960, partial [Polyangiaceae bacterium]
MRAPPRLSLVSRFSALTALLLCGCGAYNAAGSSGGGSSPGTTAGSARVERREVNHRPPINLVVRLGDPLPAVAFASAHDGGAVASVALSALILARLQAHGIGDVISVPTQSGVELAVLCPDAVAASAFTGQVSVALSTPIAEHDDALPVIAQHLAALHSRSFAGRAELEKYRAFAFAARSSAFSALGSKEFVDAAADALGKVPEWPSGDAAEDPWPSADVTDVDAADGARHLSVALRLA